MADPRLLRLPAPRRPAPGRALEARALPLAQAPEVPRDLARIHLAPGQMQVGLVDQALLIALERHPLRQHVVGVRQAGGPERARLVGELDAVLVEHLAGLGQVGHDRLVRVAEVGVRRPPEAPPALRACRLAAPDADEAEVAVHLPLLVVDARAQQLARPLLGAALAARVVSGRAGAHGLATRADARTAALEP